MSPGQIIVLATPVFLLLIALEFACGWKAKRNTYRLNDAVASIGLGMLSETTKVFTRLLRVGIYAAVYTTVSLVPIELARGFWTSWYGWLLATRPTPPAATTRGAPAICPRGCAARFGSRWAPT